MDDSRLDSARHYLVFTENKLICVIKFVASSHREHIGLPRRSGTLKRTRTPLTYPIERALVQNAHRFRAENET